jgi:hypothetical protein
MILSNRNVDGNERAIPQAGARRLTFNADTLKSPSRQIFRTYQMISHFAPTGKSQRFASKPHPFAVPIHILPGSLNQSSTSKLIVTSIRFIIHNGVDAAESNDYVPIH